jgi:hypothetical protein
MLFRRALPAARQRSAHPLPIYEMGSSTSVAITEASPGPIVRFVGWLVLLLPVMIGIGYAVFGT